MAFKKSDIPGEDIRLAMEMTAKRRQLIDETPATPLVYEYGVNRLAKALHPGFVKAVIAGKAPAGSDCVKIALEPAGGGGFPYFRAGQFVTLSCKAGDSFLSRPYSIISSPKDALEGKLEGHDHEVRYVEGVQRAGHLVDGRGERDDHSGAHAHEDLCPHE